MGIEIEWEEPPEHARVVGTGQTPGRYLQFALALREHPGRWAVLPSDGITRTPKGAAAAAQNIRRGKTKGFKAGEYDTALDGTKIYVRYTGPAKGAQAPEGAAEDQEEADPGQPLASDIRAWAVSQGIEVPERGRLPRSLLDLYLKSHERPRPRGHTLRAVER